MAKDDGKSTVEHHSAKRQNKLLFEPLEPRLLLSADIAALAELGRDGVEAQAAVVLETETPHTSDEQSIAEDIVPPLADKSASEATVEEQDNPQHSAEPQQAEQRDLQALHLSEQLRTQAAAQLVVVDPSVPEYEALLEAFRQPGEASPEPTVIDMAVESSVEQRLVPLRAQSDTGSAEQAQSVITTQLEHRTERPRTALPEGVTVVLLDSERDGVAQLTSLLERLEGIAAVHLISHGSSGNLRLGGSSVTNQSLQQKYKKDLEQWGDALTEEADILLYGCDIAQGERGSHLVSTLAALTRADIAASTDATGGGRFANWILEHHEGGIEAQTLRAEGYQQRLQIQSFSISEDTTGLSNPLTVGTLTTTLTDPNFSINGMGSDDWLFEVDAISGQLLFSTANSADYEAPSDADGNNLYEVLIDVSDGVGGFEQISAEVTVTNDSADDSGGGGSVNITSGGGGATASVSFPALTTGPITTVTADAPVGLFAIDFISPDADKFRIDEQGNLYFADNLASVDTDSQLIAQEGSGPFTVTVDIYADAFDSAPADSQTITVNIDPYDGSNRAPILAVEDPYGGQSVGGTVQDSAVMEGYTSVAELTVRDLDGADTVTMSISGGADQGLFRYDPLSGRLSFINPPSYTDYTANGGNPYEVTLTASDSQGGSSSVTYRVGVLQSSQSFAITGLSNFVVSNPTEVSLSHLSGDSSSVTTLLTNAQGTVSYQLVGGKDQGQFTIDSNGVLSFASTPNDGAPTDANGDNLYYVEVLATDEVDTGTVDEFGFPIYETYEDSLFVTVRVGQPPTITSSSSFSVGSASTAVGSVSATDPNGDTLHYAISGGSDAALFSIDSTNGALSFINAPGYNASASNDYQVEVTVSDAVEGGLTDTQTILVSVTEQNRAPTISTTAMSMVENATAAGTVVASDADSDLLSYTISGGSEASLFTIDAASGALSFLEAPDYEQPAGFNLGNDYNVEVTVSDGQGGSDTQAIVVTVTDGSDAPVIGHYEGDAFVADSEINITVTEKKLASIDLLRFADQDVVADPSGFSWQFSGADAAHFTLTQTTEGFARLSFNQALAYDSGLDADGDNVFALSLTVTDPTGLQSSPVSVLITQTRVNTAPQLEAVDPSHLWYDFDSGLTGEELTGIERILLPQNQAYVTQLSAGDAEGDGVSYSISGGAGSEHFQIDAATGVISTVDSNGLTYYANNPDYPQYSQYSLVVRVTDALGMWSERQIEIWIDEFGGARPQFVGLNPEISIGEHNTGASDSLAFINTQVDGAVLSNAILEQGGDNALFTISGGERLYALQPLDYENPLDADGDNRYELTLYAQSGNFRTYQTLTVEISDEVELQSEQQQQLVAALDHYTGRSLNPDYVAGGAAPQYLYSNLDGNYPLLGEALTSAGSETQLYQLLELIRQELAAAAVNGAHLEDPAHSDYLGRTLADSVRSQWATLQGSDKWLADSSTVSDYSASGVSATYDGYLVDPRFDFWLDTTSGEVQFEIELSLYQYLGADLPIEYADAGGASMADYLVSFSDSVSATQWDSLLGNGRAAASATVDLKLFGVIDTTVTGADAVTITPKRDFDGVWVDSSGIELHTTLSNVSNGPVQILSILGNNSVEISEDYSALSSSTLSLHSDRQYEDLALSTLQQTVLGAEQNVQGLYTVHAFGDTVSLGQSSDGLDLTAWETAHLGDLQQTSEALEHTISLLIDNLAHGDEQAHADIIALFDFGPEGLVQSIDGYLADGDIAWSTLKQQLLSALQAYAPAGTTNALDEWSRWLDGVNGLLGDGVVTVTLRPEGGVNVELHLQRNHQLELNLRVNLEGDLGLQLPLSSDYVMVDFGSNDSTAQLSFSTTLQQQISMQVIADSSGVRLSDGATLSTRLQGDSGATDLQGESYLVNSTDNSRFSAPVDSGDSRFVMEAGSAAVDYLWQSDLIASADGGGYTTVELAEAVATLAAAGLSTGSSHVNKREQLSGNLSFNLLGSDGVTALGDGAVSADMVLGSTGGFEFTNIQGFSSDQVAFQLGMTPTTVQLRDAFIDALDLFSGRVDRSDGGYDFNNVQLQLALLNQDFDQAFAQRLTTFLSTLYDTLLGYDTSTNVTDLDGMLATANQALQQLDFVPADAQLLKLVRTGASDYSLSLDLHQRYQAPLQLDLSEAVGEMAVVQEWRYDGLATSLNSVSVEADALLDIDLDVALHFDPVTRTISENRIVETSALAATVDLSNSARIEIQAYLPVQSMNLALALEAGGVNLTSTTERTLATAVDVLTTTALDFELNRGTGGSATLSFFDLDSAYVDGEGVTAYANQGQLQVGADYANGQNNWSLQANGADAVYYRAFFDLLLDGMEGMFDTIADAVSGEIGGIELPFVGSAVSEEGAALIAFFKETLLGSKDAAGNYDSGLGYALQNFASLGGLGPVEYLESKIYQGLHSYLNKSIDADGDGLADTEANGLLTLEAMSEADSAELVSYVYDDFGQVIGLSMDLFLQKVIELGGISVDLAGFMSNVLPIDLKAQVGFDVDLTAALRLGFGYDLENGFYIQSDGIVQTDDYNEDLALLLTAKLHDGTEVGVDIGVLAGHLRGDSNDQLTGLLGLDFSGAGDDDFSEDGDRGVWNLTGPYQEALELQANARLSLNATFDAELSAASILAVRSGIEVVGEWNKSIGLSGSEPMELDTPEVTMRDVTLDLGDFGSQVLVPLAQQINTFIKPLEPIASALRTELGFLPDEMNTVAAFLDAMAEKHHKPAKFQEFLDIYDGFVSLVDKVSALDGSGLLHLGDYVLNDHAIDDARDFLDDYTGLFARLNSAAEGEEPVLALDEYNQEMVDRLLSEFDANKNAELFEELGSITAGNVAKVLVAKIDAALELFEIHDYVAQFELISDLGRQGVLHAQFDELQGVIDGFDWQGATALLEGDYADYIADLLGADSDPSAANVEALRSHSAALSDYLRNEQLAVADTSVTQTHLDTVNGHLQALNSAVNGAVAVAELRDFTADLMLELNTLIGNVKTAMDGLETDVSNADDSSTHDATTQANAKRRVDYSKQVSSTGGAVEVAFPIIEGFTPVYNLLTDKTTDLFTVRMADPLSIGAIAEMEIPIIRPVLSAKLSGEVSAELMLGFGLDTHGFLEWKESGYDMSRIADVFLKGLYISDNVYFNDGSSEPNWLLNGQTYTNHDVANQVVEDMAELVLDLKISAGVSLGVTGLVEAGIGGGLHADAEFNLNDLPEQGGDLNDPTRVYDAKLYLNEIATIISKGGLDCLFDVDAQANAFLEAFIWIGIDVGFTEITIFEDDITFLEVELFSLHHHCEISDRPYKLADLNSETKELQLAFYATEDDYQAGKAYEGPYVYQVDLEKNTTHYWNGVKTTGDWIAVKANGFTEYFLSSEVDKITTIGSSKEDRFHFQKGLNDIIRAGLPKLAIDLSTGAGDDLIRFDAGTELISRRVDSGAGNDTIRGSDGADEIHAGAGYDVVLARGGDDIVYGGDDGDRLVAGLGDDLIYGEGGRDHLYLDSGSDETHTGSSGSNTVFGGSGDDLFIWSPDHGVAASQSINGGGGSDHLVLQSTRGSNEVNRVSIDSGAGIDSADLDGDGDSSEQLDYIELGWDDSTMHLYEHSSIENVAIHTAEGEDEITIGDLSRSAHIVSAFHLDTGNILDSSKGYTTVDPDLDRDRITLQGNSGDNYFAVRSSALITSNTDNDSSGGGGEEGEEILISVPQLEIGYDEGFSSFSERQYVEDRNVDISLLAGAGGTRAGTIARGDVSADDDMLVDQRFSITGGPNADLFSIDPTSGELSLNSEATWDDRGVYGIEVTIDRVEVKRDESGVTVLPRADESETLTVGIEVDNSPTSNKRTLESLFTNAGIEADVIGHIKVYESVAEDLHLSNNRWIGEVDSYQPNHFSIVDRLDDDSGRFSVDAVTGELSFNETVSVDRADPANNYYYLTVVEQGERIEVAADGSYTVVTVEQSHDVVVHAVEATQVTINYVGAEHLTIDSGAGDDTVDLRQLRDSSAFDPDVTAEEKLLASVSINAGEGNDEIWGSQFADSIDSGLGDDVVSGGWGNDSYQDAGGFDTFREVRREGYNTLLLGDTAFEAEVRYSYYADGVLVTDSFTERESFDNIFDHAILSGGAHSDTLGTLGWSHDAVLDGGGDGDTYKVELKANHDKDTTIEIVDSADDIGRDTLYVYGSDNAEAFASNVTADGQGYIASYADNAFEVQRPVLNDSHDNSSTEHQGTLGGHEQRVVYGGDPDSYAGAEQVVVDMRGGNDLFVSYDNARSLNVHGGRGNDSFIIGVITAVTTVPHPQFPDDPDRRLTVIDIGGISNGVSVNSRFYGGSGEDYFEINHNAAILDLFGESGNDLFYLQAHLMVTGTDAEGNRQTEVASGTHLMNVGLSEQHQNGNTPEGTDEQSHSDVVLNHLDTVKNNKVRIDGGSGMDSIAIGGTPLDDTFYIYTEMVDRGDGTEESVLRIYGAGLQIEKITSVEKIVLITGAGDDTIYVNGLNEENWVELYTGGGDDQVFVGGEARNFETIIPPASESFALELPVEQFIGNPHTVSSGFAGDGYDGSGDYGSYVATRLDDPAFEYIRDHLEAYFTQDVQFDYRRSGWHTSESQPIVDNSTTTPEYTMGEQDEWSGWSPEQYVAQGYINPASYAEMSWTLDRLEAGIGSSVPSGVPITAFMEGSEQAIYYFSWFYSHIDWSDLKVDHQQWSFDQAGTYSADQTHHIQVTVTLGEPTIATKLMPEGGLEDIRGNLVLRDQSGDDSLEVINSGDKLSLLNVDIYSSDYLFSDGQWGQLTDAPVQEGYWAGTNGMASILALLAQTGEQSLNQEHYLDLLHEVQSELELLNATYHGQLMNSIDTAHWEGTGNGTEHLVYAQDTNTEEQAPWESGETGSELHGAIEAPAVTLGDGQRVIWEGDSNHSDFQLVQQLLQDYSATAAPKIESENAADVITLFLPVLESKTGEVQLNYETAATYERSLFELMQSFARFVLDDNNAVHADYFGNEQLDNSYAQMVAYAESVGNDSLLRIPDKANYADYGLPAPYSEEVLERVFYAFKDIYGAKDSGLFYQSERDLLNAINAQLIEYNLEFDGEKLVDLAPSELYYIHKLYEPTADGGEALIEVSLYQVSAGQATFVKAWDMTDGTTLDAVVAEVTDNYSVTLGGEQFALEARNDAHSGLVEASEDAQWYSRTGNASAANLGSSHFGLSAAQAAVAATLPERFKLVYETGADGVRTGQVQLVAVGEVSLWVDKAVFNGPVSSSSYEYNTDIISAAPVWTLAEGQQVPSGVRVNGYDHYTISSNTDTSGEYYVDNWGNQKEKRVEGLFAGDINLQSLQLNISGSADYILRSQDLTLTNLSVDVGAMEGRRFGLDLSNGVVSGDFDLNSASDVYLKLPEGSNNRVVLSGSGDSVVYGSDSADTITGGDGDDEIHGGGGDDVIQGGSGKNRLYGDDGNDTLADGVFIAGGLGDDTITQYNTYSDDSVLLFGDEYIDGTVYSRGADGYVNQYTVVTTGVEGGDDSIEIRGSSKLNLVVGGYGADEIYSQRGYSEEIIFGDYARIISRDSAHSLADLSWLNRENLLTPSEVTLSSRPFSVGNAMNRVTADGDSRNSDRIYPQSGKDVVIGGDGVDYLLLHYDDGAVDVVFGDHAGKDFGDYLKSNTNPDGALDNSISTADEDDLLYHYAGAPTAELDYFQELAERRKLAEQTLQEAEQDYQQSNDALVTATQTIHKIDNNLTYVNKLTEHQQGVNNFVSALESGESLTGLKGVSSYSWEGSSYVQLGGSQYVGAASTFEVQTDASGAITGVRSSGSTGEFVAPGSDRFQEMMQSVSEEIKGKLNEVNDTIDSAFEAAGHERSEIDGAELDRQQQREKVDEIVDDINTGELGQEAKEAREQRDEAQENLRAIEQEEQQKREQQQREEERQLQRAYESQSDASPVHQHLSPQGQEWLAGVAAIGAVGARRWKMVDAPGESEPRDGAEEMGFRWHRGKLKRVG